jgi:hypothetical protein
MKHIPLAIAALSIVLFFFAFNPLVAFLASAGLRQSFAQVLGGVLIMLPILFIVGLNANRKVFMWIMALLALLLVVGFFLL